MFESLKEVISDTLKVEKHRITMDATMEDMDVDSLAMVELSMELEKVYGLRIGDEEMQRVSTVRDIVELIEQRSVTG